MTPSRQKALVTAAVSGPGLDYCNRLADLVLDSWLDQPTLRIYNRSSWPNGSPRRVRPSSSSRVTHARRALRAADHRGLQLPGRPTNVDVAAPPPPACPCCGRRAATRTPWPSSPWRCSSRPPARRPADRDVREGEIYRDGKIPNQRYRAWELAAGPWASSGLGAVGRALRWRLRGLGWTCWPTTPTHPTPPARSTSFSRGAT